MERFSLHFICRNFKEIPKKTQKKQGTNKQSNKMNKRNQEIFDPPPPKIRTNVDYAWQLRITYLIKSNEIFSFISFDSMLCHDVIVVFQIIYKKSVRI